MLKPDSWCRTLAHALTFECYMHNNVLQLLHTTTIWMHTTTPSQVLNPPSQMAEQSVLLIADADADVLHVF